MKKEKGKRGGNNGSVLSEVQKDWIEELNDAGIKTYVSHGFIEFKEIIKPYLKKWTL